MSKATRTSATSMRTPAMGGPSNIPMFADMDIRAWALLSNASDVELATAFRVVGNTTCRV